MPCHRVQAILGALTIVLAGNQASAAGLSVRALQQACSTSAVTSGFHCADFLSGVVDGLEATKRPNEFCLPVDVRDSTAAKAVLTLVVNFQSSDGPRHLMPAPVDNESASSFILRWLQANFHCP